MNIKSEMLIKLKNQKSCHELEKINFKKQEAAKWFVHLRDEICRSFEEIENISADQVCMTKKSDLHYLLFKDD